MAFKVSRQRAMRPVFLCVIFSLDSGNDGSVNNGVHKNRQVNVISGKEKKGKKKQETEPQTTREVG